MTKNGLPPVTAWSPAASRSASRASASTAGTENGPGSIRASAPRGSAPSARRTSGRSASASVAAGEDQAAAGGREAAPEQREQVERGVVGPVDVLDHDRRRAAVGERGEQRGQDRLAPAVLQRARERAGRRTGDVVDGAERARYAERVAGAIERPHVARAQHRADERGLPDPRLAQHERDPALGPGLVQRTPQGGLFLLAFKQLHDPVYRPYPGVPRA